MASKKSTAANKKGPTNSGADDHFPINVPIPHHMQDKDGFCGAACIMMLLAMEQIMISQSEIMREIKRLRDEEKEKLQTVTMKPAEKKLATTKPTGKKPASSRVAWHASPEEIQKALTELSKERSDKLVWRTVGETDANKVMKSISESLRDGFGAIALVWEKNLGTSLPHWVVVTGEIKDPDTEESTGYYLLDPTAPGRPPAALRYESIRHTLVGESATCSCQIWKDATGREQTAVRVWVARGRMEELLDEGAVRGVGLRYAIVGPKLPVIGKRSVGAPHVAESTEAEETVEDKIRRKRMREQAMIFWKQAGICDDDELLSRGEDQLTGGIPVKLLQPRSNTDPEPKR